LDERLEKAIEFGNYRQTLANQKRNVKSRMDTLLKVHYNSGSFVASPEKISFIKTMIDCGKTELILLDAHDSPVEITDLNDFLDTLIASYTEASNEYKTHITRINKSRSIKKLMDW